MKTIIKIVLVLSLLMLQAMPALSQTMDQLDDVVVGWKRAGQAAMPFLKLGAGARTLAMGDAALCLRGSATNLFYNPAGMAYVEGYSLMLSNMDWLLDTKIQSGAFAANLGNLGTVGLSAMFFNYGDPIKATAIDATQEFGYRDVGEFTPSEYVVGLGYARQISEQFALGAQIKLAHQNLLGGDVTSGIAYKKPDGTWARDEHDAKKTLLAFDFGTIYDTGFRGLALSMSVRNFGPQEIKYEQEAFDLPISLRIGMGAEMFQMLKMENESSKLLFNVDYLHPRDWSERVNAGIEYAWNDLIFLRGGFKHNYTSERFTLGAGLKLDLPMGAVQIDYAFKETNDTLFDAVHVYSLSLAF